MVEKSTVTPPSAAYPAVFRLALESIRTGAPGLSAESQNALARSIALKVDGRKLAPAAYGDKREAHHAGACIGTLGMTMNLRFSDDTAELVFREDDLDLVEEEGRTLYVTRLPASDVIALRQALTDYLPAAERVPDRDTVVALDPGREAWCFDMEAAPRDKTPVLLTVPTIHDGCAPIVGEAYFDPERYGGSWWWAGTGWDDYHASPLSETNEPPIAWRHMPAPAVPASAAQGKHPLDSEAEQMRLAVALTSGDHETANEIYGRAWYVDVCRAEQRLKEFVAAGKALLASLPDHWHDDATLAMRDLVEGTDIVLRPGFFTKAQQEVAFREYGAHSVVPDQSPAVPASTRSGAGEGRMPPHDPGLGPQLRSLDETFSAFSLFSKEAPLPAPAEHGVVIPDLYDARHAAACRAAEVELRDWAHRGMLSSDGLTLGLPEAVAVAVMNALSQADAAGRSERAVEIRELSKLADDFEQSGKTLFSPEQYLPGYVQAWEEAHRYCARDLRTLAASLAGRSEKGEGDGKHRILEAANTLNGEWALTIEWSDGTETVEIVGDNAAAVLGYVPEGDDA